MDIIQSAIEIPFVQALGWALFHFIWQGALIALVAISVLSLPIVKKPQTRYLLSLVFLIALAAAPITTGAIVYSDIASSTIPEVKVALAQVPAALEKVKVTLPKSQKPKSSTLLEAPSRQFIPTTPQRPEVTHSILDWKHQREKIAPYVPWCVLLWMIGVGLLAIYNLTSWVLVQRLKKRNVLSVSGEIEDTISALCEKLGITRSVQCLQSTVLAIPATIGWLKPVILLPTSTILGLEEHQLEAILAHELVHISRYDYLVNLIQTLIETVLFYHPAIWWLSKRIRVERELCCDDKVIEICQDRISYVEALTKVAALQKTSELAIAATGGDLMQRIRRIAMPTTHQEARLTKTILSIVIILTTCSSIFGPNIKELFAQEVDRNEALGARTITFPEWSMGRLSLRPWGGDWQEQREWKPFLPAMGAVEIPAGMEVRLSVAKTAALDLSPLGYLEATDLQSLILERTEVQNEQLQYIQGLELYDLHLYMTSITDEALPYIQNMTSLEALSLGRSNITNEGVQYLSKLTELRFLDLNLTGVNDEGFSHLENLTKLENLDLWNAEITDETLRLIGTFENLIILAMEGAPITDEGLAYLQNLMNLEELNIESTVVTDEGIALLTGLRSLERLNIQATRVSDEVIALLQELDNLKRVELPIQISPEMAALLGQIVRYSGKLENMMNIHIENGTNSTEIPDAKIELNWKEHKYTTYFWTEDSGSIIVYSPFGDPVELTVYAEGYVSRNQTWDFSASNEITVQLEPATVIGGFIIDEAGHHVENASVGIGIPGARDFIYNELSLHTEITDANGFWECTHAPRDLTSLNIDLSHTEFATTQYTSVDFSTARLKSRSQELVIGKGFDVKGVIVDEDGVPIFDAVLTELRMRQGVYNVTDTSVRSNEQGEFVFSNERTRTVKLKINAGGYLPLVEDIEFIGEDEPIKFSLVQGKLMNVLVVDSKRRSH